MSDYPIELEENLPADAFDDADLGAGFEEVDESTFQIPFIRLLQRGSPQCDSDSPEFIEGAEEGMYFNTVTHQMSHELVFTPSYYSHQFVRWAPRGAGGGPLGTYSLVEFKEFKDTGLIQQIEGRWYFPTENGEYHEKKSDLLADVHQLFVVAMFVPDEELCEGVIACTSTQVRKVRQLMTAMVAKKHPSGKPLPLYAHCARGTSVKESNDQGSWMGYKFELLGLNNPSGEMFQRAKAFNRTIKEGRAEVKYEESAAPPVDDGGDGEAG